MTSPRWRGILLLVAVAAAALARSPERIAAAQSPRLQYVAILSRHGVRSPTWTRERLNQFSAEPWPDFGVPPGFLTAKGRRLVGAMGVYYRAWLSREGLWPAAGCAASHRLYIWADTDQRTLETGRSFAESIAPGCDVPVHALPPGQGEDPLFDPISAGVVHPDPDVAQRAVQDRIKPRAEVFLDRRRPAFTMLDRILTNGGNAAQRPFRAPSTLGVVKNAESIEVTGPLGVASTLSENLLLDFANSAPGAKAGWGRLTAANLKQVLELHTVYADLARRTRYVAQARGSNLLSHVLRSIEQAADGKPRSGALGHADDAILMIAGHDTNLSNLSGMLGLTWRLADYPTDDTPPGGALVFSLWRDPSGESAFVKLRYVAQTLAQMKNEIPLSLAAPPASQDVPIPGCPSSAAGCPLADFVRIVQSAINPAFVVQSPASH